MLTLLSAGVAAASPQPRMVATGQVEIVWNQTRDACPGKNWAGHVGEQPDSMPLAWHNPLTNETSLISANDWGTFATVGPSLDSLRRHDCSHRVYVSINSTVPWSYANHQWMQSVQVYPNGSGTCLIHSEFHGGQVNNKSLCSTTGPGSCQYWSTSIGVTSDGGDHWELTGGAPPASRVFSTPRKYAKDAALTGFGAVGAMAKEGQYYYGHVMQVSAGADAADKSYDGTCAWRTKNLNDPGAYRGWNGSGWHTTWIDPYQTPGRDGDHSCLPIDTGTQHNAHASVRTFAGGSWRPEGWPSHLMMGWPEGTTDTVGYSFPAWETGSAAPFTEWAPAQYLDIGDWVPPQLRGCGRLMYPSLLDADSPSLGSPGGHDSGDSGDDDTRAAGLSYGLLGNQSVALYFVVGRKFIMRLPVAFLPAGAPDPAPGPYPPTPPVPNPENCSAFKVTGAGLADVNGEYRKKQGGEHAEGGPAAAYPLYQKDTDHQLYHFQSHWTLGWMGHVAHYETTSSSEPAIPVRWPGCGWGTPTVTCIDTTA
jgi:hypothetical protein